MRAEVGISSSPQLQPGEARFVEPGLRPSEADPPPRKQLVAGALCCVAGFIIAAFGGSSPLAQCLLVAGGLLIIIRLFVLGAFRIEVHNRRAEDRDMRKLYGRGGFRNS